MSFGFGFGLVQTFGFGRNFGSKCNQKPKYESIQKLGFSPLTFIKFQICIDSFCSIISDIFKQLKFRIELLCNLCFLRGWKSEGINWKCWTNGKFIFVKQSVFSMRGDWNPFINWYTLKNPEKAPRILKNVLVGSRLGVLRSSNA
jgi:hypothetical protein